MPGTREKHRARSAPKKQRLIWLDALRGFTVISMVLYHGMWDAVFLFGLDASWYHALPGYLWQQSICWTFIFLAGFSWCFDRNPRKRGLLIFGAGALATLVTTLFMPEERIVFGVLTLIGSCILLMIPLDRFFGSQGNRSADAGDAGRSVNAVRAGLLLSALLFVLTRDVNLGYLGFEGLKFAALPEGLYRGYFMTYLGFMDPGFWSTDYFSLIPWFFLFCCGYFVHRIMMARAEQSAADAGAPGAAAEAGITPALGAEEESVSTPAAGAGQKKSPALLRGLCFLGRHAMAVYIVHQPAILLVLEAVQAAKKAAGGM